MKLLFINQYYWPDTAATAQVLADLCERLARAGHDVHVFCSRGQYQPGSGRSGNLPRSETHNGVQIHRIAATGFAKRGRFGRLLDYLSFHALIGLKTLTAGWRYDTIVTLTTPPLVGIYATPIALLSRTRHVCWVMDLHPDLEFDLGLFSRFNPAARLALWLNNVHLRRADACVVLGPHMKRRLLDKRVPAGRLHEIAMWGLDLPPDSPPSPLRDQLGLAGKIVVMYSGNAGVIHTFDDICAAMRELDSDGRIAFVFVGGGRRMDQIKAFAQEHALRNTHFVNYVPRDELAGTLRLGDVHLASLREGMSGVAVPSKLYGVMAAGRSIVFVGPEACESAEHIRTHRCGFTVPIGDTAGLLAALRRLAGDPFLRREMGDAARLAFETTFNADAGFDQWRRLLESPA